MTPEPQGDNDGAAAPQSWLGGLFGSLRRPSALTIGLILAFLIGATYWNSFQCGLVLDNFLIVGNDRRLKEANWENVTLIFSRGYWWPTWESNLFRPLTTLSYMFNYSVWGSGNYPPMYHLVNLILHWVNSLLVYGLIFAVVRRNWIAAGAAAIYAVHPLNTESVTNIVGRADQLVSICILTGIHLHRLSYQTSFGSGLLLRLVMVGVAMFGVFCKESAIVLFVMLWGYDVLTYKSRPGESLRQVLRQHPNQFLLATVIFGSMFAFIGLWVLGFHGLLAFVKYLALLVLGAGFLAWFPAFLAISEWHKGVNPIAGFARRFFGCGWLSYLAVTPGVLALLLVRETLLAESPVFDEIGADNPIVAAFAFAPDWVPESMRGLYGALTGRMTAIKVIGLYAMLFVCPGTLSCDYSYDQIKLFTWTFTDLGDLFTWASLIFVAGSLVWMHFAVVRNRPLFFFMWLFWIAFGPTSNLVRGVGSIMGERFMYLPLVGVVGGLAVLVANGLDQVAAISVYRERRMKVILSVLTVVMVIGFGVRSFIRNFDWKDEMSLWTSAASACPDSFKVYKGLAGAIVGLSPESKPPEFVALAIETSEKGTTILEEKPLPPWHMPNGIFQDVARYYLIQGDNAARAADPTMMKIAPEARHSYERAAHFLKRARDMDRSVNEKSKEDRRKRGMDESKIIDVGNYRIYQNLGVVFMRLGEWDQAAEALLYMSQLEPTAPEAYFNLGMVRMAQNRGEEAAVLFLESLIIKGDWKEPWMQLQRLYNVLAPNQGLILTNDQGQFQLKQDNPIIRKHFLRALHDLCDTMIKAKRYGAALDIRKMAQERHQAPPEVFADLDPLLNHYIANLHRMK